jgi:hypothetical protein
MEADQGRQAGMTHANLASFVAHPIEPMCPIGLYAGMIVERVEHHRSPPFG